MKIRVLMCLIACISLVVGCRKNSAQLAEQVKMEMQQEFTKRAGLKNLVVETVRLVKKSEDGIDYSGVAVGAINGEYVKFDVNCKYDGTSVLWDADLSEGSLEALKLKETARETYQLLKASWPKATSAIAEKYNAAVKSAAEGYDAATKKVGELYDRAKEKASEIVEDTGRKINEAAARSELSAPAKD